VERSSVAGVALKLDDYLRVYPIRLLLWSALQNSFHPIPDTLLLNAAIWPQKLDKFSNRPMDEHAKFEWKGLSHSMDHPGK